MTSQQISELVKNVNVINKTINSLDDIGYRDFLHTIGTDYDRLKFTNSILSDAGFYRTAVTTAMVMKKINPQQVSDEYLD